uniref:Uncharacterized protein n=1 Tax=viral metagenome TaxID=1070528 RepID=A0A6C0I6T2_9ZZZZ
MLYDQLQKSLSNEAITQVKYPKSNLDKMYKLKINQKKNNMYFGDLYPSYTEMLSDIIIYVILVCNILTVLFFTIVKDIEGNIVKQQINYLLDDIFSSVKNTNGTETQTINTNENKNIEEIKKLYNVNTPEEIKKLYDVNTPEEIKKLIQDNINNSNIKNSNNTNQFDPELIIQNFQKYKQDLKTSLKNSINNLQSDNITEQKIKKNNDEIFKKSIMILSIVNIICLILLAVLWFYNKYDIVYYLKKNIILSLFVIVTELLFLYIISNKYMYIDKKYVMMETIKKINKN